MCSVSCDKNLYSMSVMHHFSAVFKNDDSLLKILLSKNSVRLCCVGACQAITTFGICKLFNDALEKLQPAAEKQFKIQLFIIDENETFEDVIRKTVKETNKILGNVKLRCYYLRAYLQTPFDEQVSRRIHKAHVVIMVKFCYDRNCFDNLRGKRTLSEILFHMKEDSWLFYFHDTKNGCCKLTEEEMTTNLDFAQIYSSAVGDNSPFSFQNKSENGKFCCNPQSRKPIVRVPVALQSVSCFVWVKLYSTSKTRMENGVSDEKDLMNPVGEAEETKSGLEEFKCKIKNKKAMKNRDYYRIEAKSKALKRHSFLYDSDAEYC